MPDYFVPSAFGSGDDATAVASPAAYRGFGLGIPRQTLPESQRVVEILKPRVWYDWHWDQIGLPHDTPNTRYIPCMYNNIPPTQPDRGDCISALEFCGISGRIVLGPNESDHNQTVRQAVRAVGNASNYATFTSPSFAWEAESSRHGRFAWTWLEKYMNEGGLSPEMWNPHFYGAETPSQFDDLWQRWLEWKWAMGFGNDGIPTIISEVNASPGDVNQHMALMDHVAEMVEAGIISAALWFSACYYEMYDANLMTTEYELTRLGEHARYLFGSL